MDCLRASFHQEVSLWPGRRDRHGGQTNQFRARRATRRCMFYVNKRFNSGRTTGPARWRRKLPPRESGHPRACEMPRANPIVLRTPSLVSASASLPRQSLGGGAAGWLRRPGCRLLKPATAPGYRRCCICCCCSGVISTPSLNIPLFNISMVMRSGGMGSPAAMARCASCSN